MSAIRKWLRYWVPATHEVTTAEKFRASLGAALGICLTGLMGLYAQSISDAPTLWLIAPMGASAVLIFAAPASPLAQPWSVFGGNTLSALTAIALLHVFPANALTAGVAVGLAIGVMFITKSLHPPGGATALLIVLTQANDLHYAWDPVAINAFTLAVCGMAYHRLTGKPYPHHPPHEPLNELTLKRDLEKVLSQHDEYIDISMEDIEVILEEVMRMRGADQRNGALRIQSEPQTNSSP